MIATSSCTILSIQLRPQNNSALRNQKQWLHRLTPQLSPERSGSSSSSGDGKDAPNKTPPVQTLNKSPIVQKLWRTRDEAKRRVMGELTLGDGEYSDVSLAAAKVLSEAKKNNDEYKPPSDPSKGKLPHESEVGIEYLFSQDQFLLETYRNPWGEMR